MKKYRKIVITLVAIFIWCGMMYPELSFPDEVLMVSDGTDGEWRSCTSGDVYDFLQAGPGQIEVKSRVLEFLDREYSGQEE